MHLQKQFGQQHQGAEELPGKALAMEESIVMSEGDPWVLLQTEERARHFILVIFISHWP